MKLFPLIRGHVNLTITKGELFKYLKETCDEDCPIVFMGSFADSNREYGFGLDLYDDSFVAWEIPSSPLSNWIFTTINGKVTETSEGIRLDYHIRYNLWTNFLIVAMSVAICYYWFRCIIDNISVDLLTSLLGTGVVLSFFLSFNGAARSHLEFIKELEKRLASTSHEK